MVLVINGKSMNRVLCAAVFYMFIMGFLIHDIGLPIGIMALLDIIVAFGLLFSLRSLSKRLSYTKAGTLFTICAVLFFVGVLHALLERVSPTLILDGMRNSFRGMFTFMVAVCLLQKDTIKKIIHLIELFFRINIVVCTIQFFLLGVSHDNCNGLFGAGKMNSWTNILLCVISILYFSQYMNRLIPLRRVVVNIVLCLYVAILAELKFYFFELIMIAMVMVLLEKPSWRTFALCLVGGLALSGMLTLFIAFWEDSSMFTIEGIRYYLDPDRSFGYSAMGDWGRIGGIANATKKFFSQSLNLFGMGLGYCGFDTPFYDRYGWLHYNWFSYISIFLEQGWVGTIGYFSFFVVSFLTLRKRRKTAKTADARVIYDISMIMSLLGVVLMIYNSTVTGYPAFFLFLLLGIAYRYELDDGVTSKAEAYKEQSNGYLINDNSLKNSSLG